MRASMWPVIALLSCQAAAPAGPNCPPAGVLESLHAAAFHFEHGTPDAARTALARARAGLGAMSPAPREARQLLARLEVVDRALPSDPARARSETEWIRMSLQDWACLPPALHAEFHTRLPAIE